MPGSPAARAGLKGLQRSYDGHVYLGDVIVGVEGRPIKNFNEFYRYVIRQGVGKKIQLKVKSGHRYRKVTLRIADVG